MKAINWKCRLAIVFGVLFLISGFSILIAVPIAGATNILIGGALLYFALKKDAKTRREAREAQHEQQEGPEARQDAAAEGQIRLKWRSDGRTIIYDGQTREVAYTYMDFPSDARVLFEKEAGLINRSFSKLHLDKWCRKAASDEPDWACGPQSLELWLDGTHYVCRQVPKDWLDEFLSIGCGPLNYRRFAARVRDKGTHYEEKIPDGAELLLSFARNGGRDDSRDDRFAEVIYREDETVRTRYFPIPMSDPFEGVDQLKRSIAELAHIYSPEAQRASETGRVRLNCANWSLRYHINDPESGEPEELCFSGTDNCDAWFADTLRAALERLSVLMELYEPRFCDWEASSGRVESVNRFKTELKRLFSRGEKVNPSMEPMSFSVQAGGKAGGFPATPAEMEYQALVDISNLEWTGMDEAFKHASRYAEYGPYLHFYVPATGSRFAIEGDGNYYHGYDIVISRLSDVCPKQEKRELFGVHRDRHSFPLVVGKELEPGRHGWTLVSEMFSGADAAAASADKAPLPQKGPPLSADSAHSCPACGHQLIPGHPFCEHCGTSVPVCRKGEHVFHWRETAVYLMGADGLVYDERKVKYVCKYCSITCDTLDEAQKIGTVEM